MIQRKGKVIVILNKYKHRTSFW